MTLGNPLLSCVRNRKLCNIRSDRRSRDPLEVSLGCSLRRPRPRRHSKHEVKTLHETFSAKLLSHDIISLECETKHTNLTMVNERQINVTSCTNCSYLISIFIPLNVDNVGDSFYLFTLFLPLFHWMSISLGIVFIYFYLSLKKTPNYF